MGICVQTYYSWTAMCTDKMSDIHEPKNRGSYAKYFPQNKSQAVNRHFSSSSPTSGYSGTAQW